jgi:predicted PurR-regulated permease PerM
MINADSAPKNGGFFTMASNIFRLIALLIIIFWCYQILAPFIPLMLWAAIMAVAVYPLYQKLAKRLGNRWKLTATLLTLLGLIILTTPVVVLTESLVSSSKVLAEQLSEGSLSVPAPPDHVKGWPMVGEKLHSGWLLASQNLGAALNKYGPQFEALSVGLIATAGGAGAAFLQMLISIIIAGVFLATADGSIAGTRTVVNWLVGERSPLLLAESTTTVRSVARGVLGVAILEAIVAAIGLVSAGVPAPGLWTFLILVLSIVQVPPLLTLVPLSIWALAATEPLGAVVLIICTILVVLIDTFLKPVLLGRTADAPMLVVLLGAIGGMMVWGVVGLFVGAVILVLCWGAMEFWIKEESAAATESPNPPKEPVK